MAAFYCLIMVMACGRCLSAQVESQTAHSSRWQDLTQEPYEQLSIQDIGLKPLLLTRSGEKITTRTGWERQRKDLRAAWVERLGRPPAKPENRDSKIESREVEPDHVRILVSFCAEGDDRIRAYLLVPKDVKEGSRRPAIVVFHPTTKETVREPVGLGKRQELALALELV